jgi:NitT/TauT family transport system substrate-binding protein
MERRMTISKFSLAGLSRRNFMALAGAGTVAAGLSGRAFAQAEPTDLAVQLNWLETADFAPAFAAEMMGYDVAHGIRQSFVPGGPQIDPIQSVAGGSAPVGFAASVGQCALARASGIPIKIFGAFNRTSPIGLISLAENAITTPADAVGKRIGLQGGARLAWSIILKENALSEGDMTIVPVAGDVSPLVSKQVDGFWGSAVNQHISLARAGVPNHIMTRSEVGAPEHFGVLFALESTLAERRDDIVAWLAALVEGQRYYMGNSDIVADHIVARSPALQLNTEQLREQSAAIISFINVPGKDLPLLRLDEEGGAQAISQLDAQGQLPSPVSLADLLDGSLLDEAYAVLG